MIKNELTQTDLKTHDFYFELPEELISQHAYEKRDEARLMVLDRETKTIEHRIFRDITDYLRPGDVLVINDSKVIPARIYGKKVSFGEANVEFVLLRQKELDTWEVLARPGKRLREGAQVVFGDGKLRATVLSCEDDGCRIVKFDYDKTGGATLYSILDEIGKMPLPPYITAELKNNSDYQTVYAREEGSAAAPTAGLHFTEELLDKIRGMGVDIAPVMLHVGLGIIYPGYKFKAVDMLITNFHLPESTLIMLVSALAGKDFVMSAYAKAIEEKYKFFSFGDAMLIK